jgi:hypothetical protein
MMISRPILSKPSKPSVSPEKRAEKHTKTTIKIRSNGNGSEKLDSSSSRVGHPVVLDCACTFWAFNNNRRVAASTTGFIADVD